MFKTTSYVLRQLFFVTLFVTLILTVAVWLTQSLRFIEVVVNKGLPITTFFYLVIFLLPDLVSVVLPGAFMVSILFIYNRLTADQELIVMRSIGLSNWQLAKPALILATLLTILMYGTSLYLLPKSYGQLKDTEHEIRGMISQSILQVGEFYSIKGLMVFIRAQENENEVSGIILYDARESDDKHPPLTITAERGTIVKDQNGINLILLNGIRHGVDPKTNIPSMLFFDQYSLNLSQQKAPEPRYRKPHEHSIFELLNPSPHLTTPQQRAKFRAQGHRRLLSPLYIMTFALIALSTLLSGEFNRRFRSRRVVVSVGLCTLFQMMIITLTNMSERFALLLPLGYVIVILTNLLALSVLLERKRGRSK
ncbi:MAG: LptF/LptG family permease [Pseudomonadota bacterium]